MTPLNKAKNTLKLVAKMDKEEWKDSLHLNDKFLIRLMFTAKQKSTSLKIQLLVSQPTTAFIGVLLSLMLQYRPGCIQRCARIVPQLWLQLLSSNTCWYSCLRALFLSFFTLRCINSVTLVIGMGGWNQQGGGRHPSNKAGRRIK